MQSNNVLSFLGIMRKAGSLALGNEAVFDAISFGQARLVIFAKDASPNTVRGIKSTLMRKPVPNVVLQFTKEELGGAVGYGGCAVIAICNSGFAKALAEKLELSELAHELDEKTIREKRRLAKKHRAEEKL